MKTFREIIGHEQIKDHMQTAVRNHKVSHAYILSGEAGMGKKTLAEAFAMTLLCEQDGIEPCMECHACKQVLSGSHPDLVYVTHEKPNTIGVEDIRTQINDTIMVRPYSSYYKIYIVDEAEKMTQQAQNALLKTIEEPPAYAIIMLLTANEGMLLPTIKSRCVTLTMKPVPLPLIRQYLMEELQIPDYRADICAAFSQGNVCPADCRSLPVCRSDISHMVQIHGLHTAAFWQIYRPASSCLILSRLPEDTHEILYLLRWHSSCAQSSVHVLTHQKIPAYFHLLVILYHIKMAF